MSLYGIAARIVDRLSFFVYFINRITMPYNDTSSNAKERITINHSLIFVFYLLIFVFLNCIPYIQKGKLRSYIRVAVVCGVDYVEISGRKGSELHNDYGVSLSDNFPLYFNSYKGPVAINGKKYRGDLEIQNIEQKIWIINILDVENYLKGVVPCEIGRVSAALIEVAKAQAVAARTYAYAHLNQYEQFGFDLYATIQDQVYHGISAEHEWTNLAIEQTRGEILAFRGLPIEAKYHSTCGGRTAEFNDAWSGEPPPYLRSVKCSYCENSPYYTWTKEICKKDFFLNLRARLLKIGFNISKDELIKGFKLTRNRKSGRVNRMIITTTESEYEIKTYNIRKLLGDKKDPGGLLMSNYFTLQPKGDSIEISGRGYGHGVGMCQFGAIEMARKGRNYKEILYYYYPGTKIIYVFR